MLGRMKKKIALLLILIALGPASLWANMPVIDLSAITSGITQFMQTVEQYGRQIKQWQQEYERIMNAAKAIATGDFNQIMNGLQSIASQMSGWNSTNFVMDNFLDSFGDSVGMLQGLVNDASSLGGNLMDSWEMVSKIGSPGSSGWDIVDWIGDTAGTIGTATQRTGSMLGNYFGDMTDLLNEQIALQEATKTLFGDEELEKLQQQKADLEEKLNGGNGTDGYIKQLLDAYGDEQEVKAQQLEAQIANTREQIRLIEEQIKVRKEAAKLNEERTAEVAEEIAKQTETSNAIYTSVSNTNKVNVLMEEKAKRPTYSFTSN